MVRASVLVCGAAALLSGCDFDGALEEFEDRLDGGQTLVGRPSAPTNVVATAGDRQITVTWTPPADNGGSPILDFTATANPGGASTTVIDNTATITGLTNGVGYTIEVRARNANGPGVAGTSLGVTPATVPGAPTNVQVARGDGSVSLTWLAPADDGGRAVTTYTVTASPGSATATVSGTSATVSGLTNGTSYTFTVHAANGIGAGAESAASEAIVPAGLPGAPTGIVASRGDGQVTLSWTAPTATGGVPILGYTVVASPGGATATTDGATTTSVSGLTNGTSYTFEVFASNLAGNGTRAQSSAVTPATHPEPPTGVVATPGSGQATVSWSAPIDNGGALITGYRVTASPGGATFTTTGALSVVATGLVNGTPYTFTVAAQNAIGFSPESQASAAVSPAALPDAPTGVSGIRGNAEVTVSWTAPSGNGSAISGYTVTANPGGATATASGATTTATVTGLANGSPYTFTVTATNAVGTGPASAPSASVTPATVPLAPTIGTATPGNTEATVGWTAPTNNGGDGIVSYTVVSNPGGHTATVSFPATSATITGLSNGTAYTFTVYATNTVGNGPSSAASGAVTPATPPGPPTAVTGTRGNGQVSVTWMVPGSDGGSPITGYTVTASPGGATAASSGAATTATVTGLSNGTAYTFTVRASNAMGAGPASSASAPVTPATVPGAPGNFTATRGDGQVTVNWNAPASDGGDPITGYRLTTSPGGTQTFSSTTTSTVVTGLVNGTAYTFSLTAVNSVGVGSQAGPTPPVTPAGLPFQPTNLTAVRGDQEVRLSWTAPGSNGDPIVSYTATASPGGATASGTGTSLTFGGLTNGVGYTFTVHATNGVGDGPESSSVGPTTPVALTDVVALTPPSAFSSCATIAYALYQRSAQQADVRVEYSLDAGPFLRATQVGSNFGSGVTGVQTSANPAGQAHTFFWNTSADLPRLRGTVRIRITAVIAGNDGASLTSAAIPIDNAPGLAPQALHDVGVGPSQLVTGDFNGDNRVDLATVLSNEDSVAVMLNDGAGSLAPATSSSTFASPNAGVTADFTGDGLLDLVVGAGGVTPKLQLLEGNGAGAFSGVQLIDLTAGVYALAVADVNLDGRLDVVALTDSAIRVFPGQAAPALLGAAVSTSLVSYNSVRGLELADLNNDGKLDVVFANFGGNNASVYLGSGGNTFTFLGNYQTGTGPSALAAGDLDRDGKLDLVTANTNAGNISVLRGIGDGSFAAPVNTGTGPNTTGLRMVDLDRDNKLDLAVTVAGNNALLILRGNGNRTFQPAVSMASSSYPALVTSADLDADGYPEVLTGNYDWRVHRYANLQADVCALRGDGPVNATANGEFGQAHGIAVTDFNGDGRADVAIGGGSSYYLTGRGRGDGTFQPLYGGYFIAAPVGIAAADVTGDGRPDVITVSTSADAITVLESTSNGQLAPLEYGAGIDPRAVVFSDLDRDGDLDAITANSGGNDVSVLDNPGNGSFAAPVNFAAGTTPHALVAADLSGDGRPDLAVANRGSNDVSVLLALPTGGFAAAVPYAVEAAPQGLVAVDLEGDGDLDLAVVNNLGDSVSLLANGGSGAFAALGSPLPVGDAPVAITAANFDAALGVDLAVVNSTDSTVSVLRGQGDGTFSAAVAVRTGTFPDGIAVGEFNGDTIPDFAVSGTSDGAATIHLGVASGLPRDPYAHPAGSFPNQVATGDFNRDGKQDVVTVATGTPTEIALSLGNGDGTLAARQALPTPGPNPFGLGVGDFNRDGRLDLVVTNQGDNTFSFYAGNGDGTFAAPAFVPTASGPGKPVVADLDRDGALDLVVPCSGSGAVSVFRGDGSGSFSAKVDFAAGDNPTSVAVGDYNRDQELDLVVTNWLGANGNSISVLLGTGGAAFQAPVRQVTNNYPFNVVSGDFDRDGLLDLVITSFGATYKIAFLMKGNGDGTFQDWVQTDYIGSYVRHLVVGDIDRDGKLDLATANETSGDVSLLHGNGDGTFTSVQYGGIASAMGVSLADLNGDGIADLVATSNTRSAVVVVPVR